jgi:hypothetical protein
MGNAQRMMLSEDIEDVIDMVGQNEAHRLLEGAYEIQEREKRAMSLEEALRIVRGVAAQVEAIG